MLKGPTKKQLSQGFVGEGLLFGPMAKGVFPLQGSLASCSEELESPQVPDEASSEDEESWADGGGDQDVSLLGRDAWLRMTLFVC